MGFKSQIFRGAPPLHPVSFETNNDAFRNYQSRKKTGTATGTYGNLRCPPDYNITVVDGGRGFTPPTGG